VRFEQTSTPSALGFTFMVRNQAVMSELLQFIIVAAFGALCFGCGYATPNALECVLRKDDFLAKIIEISEAR
jgi:hypothetical protein